MRFLRASAYDDLLDLVHATSPEDPARALVPILLVWLDVRFNPQQDTEEVPPPYEPL